MKYKVFIIVALLGFKWSLYAQCHSELTQYAVGFNDLKSSSFSFLDDVLKDVKIVGYGEDTHGTSEFTLLAEELITYLSDTHGFKIFVLETGFGEGQYLNDYIQGKTDDLKFIMNNRNQTWRYRTKAFYQLMNALKVYNQNATDKIHIYGCEMQYVVTDLNRIKDYLKKVDSNYTIEGFEKVNLWQNFNEQEKVKYFNSYAKLKAYFIENYEIFKNKTSQNEFDLAFHQVEVLGQFVTAINQNVYQRKHDFREIYMLENIQWILNYEGRDSKLFYWAHNAHIGDMTLNGTSNSIGRLLKNSYGEYYFSIGTDFGTGNFIAYPADANETGNWRHQTFTVENIVENTFTQCLKNLGKPNAFLNFRKANTNNDLKLFLSEPLTQMSEAGAQIRSNITETSYLGKEFDAIIYLNETHEIKWVD